MNWRSELVLPLAPSAAWSPSAGKSAHARLRFLRSRGRLKKRASNSSTMEARASGCTCAACPPRTRVCAANSEIISSVWNDETGHRQSGPTHPYFNGLAQETWFLRARCWRFCSGICMLAVAGRKTVIRILLLIAMDSARTHTRVKSDSFGRPYVSVHQSVTLLRGIFGECNFMAGPAMLIAVCVAVLLADQRKRFSPAGSASSWRICRGLRPVSTSLRRAFSQWCD